MKKEYSGLVATSAFALKNYDPRVEVGISALHHHELEAAAMFLEKVGTEVIDEAARQNLVAPKQFVLKSEGLEHRTEV